MLSPKKEPEDPTLAAARIAKRDAELKRAYDQDCATRLGLLLEHERVSDALAKVERRIRFYRTLAERLGRPGLLSPQHAG